MQDWLKGRIPTLVARRATPAEGRPSAAPDGRPIGAVSMLADLAMVPAGPGRAVVLLCDENVRSELAQYLRTFRDDRVLVLAETCLPDWELGGWRARFAPTPTRAATHQELAKFGPVDVLVNLRTGTADDHLQWWYQVFLHLREHGCLAVERRRITDADVADTGLVVHLGGLARFVGARRATMAGLTRLDAEQALSTSQILLTSELIVVRKRMSHLLKLRDGNATQVLNQRATGLEVTPLATLKAGRLHLTGTQRAYGTGAGGATLGPDLKVPELHLRRYRGQVGLCPGTIAFHDHTLLPDTFRWAREERLRNPRLVDVDARFARLPQERRPVEELGGSFYYLDHYNVGHFGHVMTELVAKLWGWDAAKAADPSLKVLLRETERATDRPAPRLEERLLTAYGIDRDDIVWVDRPVWVSSVVGASPMWHNAEPYYAHPQIASVWSRLRAGLREDGAPGHPRIFVARPPGTRNRRCHNAAEVEELFESHGFVVIHPENLDFARQVGVFSRAEVVAGFGGSGMFNVLFAERAHTMIVLSHDAYDSRNEHLYAAVLGLDAHFFLSPHDAPPSEGERPREAFQSSWSFDFARRGKDLERVLAGLDA